MPSQAANPAEKTLTLALTISTIALDPVLRRKLFLRLFDYFLVPDNTCHITVRKSANSYKSFVLAILGVKHQILLDNSGYFVMLVVQSESVTLSVDYLISSTQAGHAPAWVFLLPPTHCVTFSF